MSIKSWYKFNESSSQDLTEDMILNIIYFRNCSIDNGYGESSNINKSIDSLIDIYLSDKLDFESEDLTFANRKDYYKVQKYIHQIYKITLEDLKFKKLFISIYQDIKKIMGKILFTDYEDILLEFIDDGFDIDFCFKPGHHMKIDIKKVSQIDEHISCLQKATLAVKRITKVFNLPENVAYISTATYESEPSHNESHIEITIL